MKPKASDVLRLGGNKEWNVSRTSLFAGRLFFLALIALLGARSGADNIFDDNWTPPPPKHPAPATSTEPANANHDVTLPVKPGTTKAPSDKPSSVSPTPVIVAPARQAVPSKADQGRSRAILKEVFAKQLADRSAAGRYKLGQDLLEAERKITDNPVDRFVLLSAAVQAGREAGSVPLCFEAADGMAEAFEVDDLAVRTDAMLKMSFAGVQAGDAARNVGPGLELLDQLVASGDFNTATKLCTVLQKASANSTAEREIVQKRIKEFGTLRTAHDEFLIHKAKLEQWPDDPAANFAVGSYYCFVENRWNIGMTLLLKGNNAAVKAAVAAEQSSPKSEDHLVAVGDRWWDAAEREAAMSPGQISMRRHAAAFYTKTLETARITGLSRLRLEKRIELAGKSESPPARALVKRRNVLLWSRSTVEVETYKAIAEGRLQVVAKGDASRLSDPSTYVNYTMIVFGPNSWRDLSMKDIPEKATRSLFDFVSAGGDLIIFEQFGAGNMRVIDDLFGIKTHTGPTGALVDDQELRTKLQAAGYDEPGLQAIHFYNTYSKLPEGTRILLRGADENRSATAVIAPFGKGRLILVGTTWDKREEKLDEAILQVIYASKASKP